MCHLINRGEGDHARVDDSGLSRQNRGPLSVPGSNVGELYGNLGGSKPPRISVPCHILRFYLAFGYDRGERLPFPGSPPAVRWVNEGDERAGQGGGVAKI